MHTIPGRSGRFRSRLWIEDDEFDFIAFQTLRKNGLYPAKPSAIDIELLVETLFSCGYEFADLEPDLMGCIRFGAHGPTSIRIQKHLDNWQNVIINRRCRSTLAHECSHGILHSGLFAELWKERRSRNPGRDGDVLLADGTENLDETPVESRGEEWLEHQANRLMASLLLPMPLVIAQIGERWLEGDPYSRLSLKDRRALARPLAEAFDVNPVLARHRLEDIFCKVVPRLRYLADSGKPDTYRTIPNFCHPPEVFLEALAA